jgi:hypothetical protein
VETGSRQDHAQLKENKAEFVSTQLNRDSVSCVTGFLFAKQGRAGPVLTGKAAAYSMLHQFQESRRRSP